MLSVIVGAFGIVQQVMVKDLDDSLLIENLNEKDMFSLAEDERDNLTEWTHYLGIIGVCVTILDALGSF